MASFAHQIRLLSEPLRRFRNLGTCEKGSTSNEGVNRCQAMPEFECSYKQRRNRGTKSTFQQISQALCREHTEAFAKRYDLPIPEPDRPQAEPEIIMQMPEQAFTNKPWVDPAAPKVRKHRLPRDKRKEVRICIRFQGVEVARLDQEAVECDRKISDYLRFLIATRPGRPKYNK